MTNRTSLTSLDLQVTCFGLYKKTHLDKSLPSCDYYLKCVLPIDPKLARIIWAELLREEDVIRPNERTCAWCGGSFMPNSNRQQYCQHCKPLHERLRNRNKQRSYYQRKRMKSA